MTVKKHVSELLRMLLWIGFSLQVVLGGLWCLGNLDFFQMFGESAFLISVSQTLQGDEYTGVLYPALLLLVRSISGIVPVPWYVPVYLLQITFGVYAGAVLLHTIGFFRGNWGLCVAGGLCISTFPFVMQVHMTILPLSLMFSLLCLYLSQVWRCSFVLFLLPKRSMPGPTGAMLIARVCLFWLLLSLTCPEMLYVGAVPVVILLVWMYLWLQGPVVPGKKELRSISRMVNYRRWIWGWYPLLTALLFLLLIWGGQRLTQHPGLYGRPIQSVEKTAFDRTAWKSLLMRPWSWPEELKEIVPEEVLEETSRSADMVQLLLEPTLEDSIGSLKARTLYVKLARRVWTEHRGELAHDVSIDFLGYLCPPFIMGMQMAGKEYLSCNIRNYDVMKRKLPSLTRWYMEYSLAWFFFALIVVVVLALLHWKQPTGRVILISGWAISWAMNLIFCCAATMRGSGLLDYKWGIFSVLLWITMILLQMDGKET